MNKKKQQELRLYLIGRETSLFISKVSLGSGKAISLSLVVVNIKDSAEWFH